MTSPNRSYVELTIKGDLQALRLQPGDILVASLSTRATAEEADHIAKRLNQVIEAAGLNNQVVIVSDGVRLEANRD